MAQLYFPFNSVNKDRKYKAEDWARYFALFLSNGIFNLDSTQLKVVANNDMTIKINAGNAFINGRCFTNDTAFNIPLSLADGLMSRIDRIVICLDYSNRMISLKVKEGEKSLVPVAPSLQRDADRYELGLADIKIAKGAVSIGANNITDLRLQHEYCGIVTGLIEQADTTALFNQYQAALDLFLEESEEWKTALQTAIDDIVSSADNMFKSTYDDNNDGIVNAADNGIFIYVHTAGSLAGSGVNGKFKASVSETVGSIAINGVSYAVKGGTKVVDGNQTSWRMDFIAHEWYQFVLDANTHTITFVNLLYVGTQIKELSDRITTAKSTADTATTKANNAQNTANGKAPTCHTHAEDIYGRATGGQFGHVRMTDYENLDSSYNADNGGWTVSPWALSKVNTKASAAQSTADTATTKANNAQNTANAAMPKTGGTFSGNITCPSITATAQVNAPNVSVNGNVTAKGIVTSQSSTMAGASFTQPATYTGTALGTRFCRNVWIKNSGWGDVASGDLICLRK